MSFWLPTHTYHLWGLAISYLTHTWILFTSHLTHIIPQFSAVLTGGVHCCPHVNVFGKAPGVVVDLVGSETHCAPRAQAQLVEAFIFCTAVPV